MQIFPLTSRQKVVVLFTGIVFCVLIVFNTLLFATNERRWRQEQTLYVRERLEDIRTFGEVIRTTQHLLILGRSRDPLHAQGIFERFDYTQTFIGADRIIEIDRRSYFIAEYSVYGGDTLVFALDVTDVVTERDDFLYAMSVFSGFGLAVIFIIAVLFSYVLYEPFRDITKKARAFAPRKPVEEQLIPLEGNPADDIYLLSDTLNTLFRRVHEETKNLEQFSDDLAHEFKNKIFEIQSSIDIARAKEDYRE